MNAKNETAPSQDPRRCGEAGSLPPSPAGPAGDPEREQALLAEVRRARTCYDNMLAHYQDQVNYLLWNQQERDWAKRAQAAEAKAKRLHDAIAAHHAQKADDRCIEDDDRLYAAAGLPPCDRRVGDKLA